MEPAAALRRIAFVLERANAPSFRVRAFRRAAATIDELPAGELERLCGLGRLKDLAGVGDVTATVIAEALEGAVPGYLAMLEAEAEPPAPGGATIRALLRGDCHVHSDWSDGGSPIREMAEAAISLGHEYIVLTDHSPRLKVARGLSAERLRQQLEVVRALNLELAPFRVLTGIEVDILDDGALDQDAELLEELDIVVASAHSKLRMEREAMTSRMLAAIANPHLDILGHCTGRLLGRDAESSGRGGAHEGSRPESEFDAEAVFAACVRYDRAVEINARPERLDPPRRLLRLAREIGCRFAINTDAHAPGQLDWLENGCARAAECNVEPGRIVNTLAADNLVNWARRGRRQPGA